MSTITNERATALNIIINVLEQDGYNNLSLRSSLEQSSLTREQRAFVTSLVNGTLRELIRLDYIINLFASVKISKMRPKVRGILRLGAYELLYMNSPDYAVLNQWVEISKKSSLGKLSGFINAVLRNIQRNRDNLPMPKSGPEQLSVAYSHPLWIIKKWLSEYGEEITNNLLKFNQNPPQAEQGTVGICVNTLKTDKPGLSAILQAEGVSVFDEPLFDRALRLSHTANIGNLSAFKDGLFHVMDPGALSPVYMAQLSPGETVVDICAAPGGKSFAAAVMMKDQGQVISRDIFDHKVKLIEEGAKRLGLKSINAEVYDGRNPDKDIIADCVLLDAPCSGLGLLRRKPDIKIKRQPGDLKEIINLQRELLASVATMIKPGGRLIYSTCTLSKTENEDNVRWFTENFPFELESEQTLWPFEFNTDGFYAAKLIRK